MSFFDYVFGDRTRLNHPRASDSQTLTFVCDRCRNPFDTKLRLSGKPRDSIEYEPLRKKLMITDPNYDPVICDACFVDIMSHKTESPMSDGMPGSNMPLVMRQP